MAVGATGAPDNKKSQTQPSCIAHHPGKQDAWGHLPTTPLEKYMEVTPKAARTLVCQNVIHLTKLLYYCLSVNSPYLEWKAETMMLLVTKLAKTKQA